jgi:hypothetical protein
VGVERCGTAVPPAPPPTHPSPTRGEGVPHGNAEPYAYGGDPRGCAVFAYRVRRQQGPDHKGSPLQRVTFEDVFCARPPTLMTWLALQSLQIG